MKFVANIVILVSGNGSNMQSIIDSTKDGILKGLARVVLAISSNPEAYALERARCEKIKALCIERKKFKDEKAFNDIMLKNIQNEKADLICLAGFIRMVGRDIIKAYPNKILNIHPALLPKFGGKGMYGHYVHESVVKAKEKKSGATVHFVEEEYDRGDIIMQQEITVLGNDAPEDVGRKVLALEHQIYPKAIKKVIENLNRG